MTSARKIKANCANAKVSTGPKTRFGKSRVAQNARRHGLSVSIFADPARSAEISDLGLQIAGEGVSADAAELARRVAEAQIDLNRVRQARLDLLARHLNNPNYKPKGDERRLMKVATLLKFYARRFGPHTPLPTEVGVQVRQALHWKPEGTEKFMYILRDLHQQLTAFDRYERRALSRRKFAIRQLDALRRRASTNWQTST